MMQHGSDNNSDDNDTTLQWRHNERDGVSNHRRLDRLLNRLSRRSKKHQSSASLAFVRGIYRWSVDSLTKDQLHGKCFHLMTSSWTTATTIYEFCGQRFIQIWNTGERNHHLIRWEKRVWKRSSAESVCDRLKKSTWRLCQENVTISCSFLLLADEK